jgi:hypothetical protein
MFRRENVPLVVMTLVSLAILLLFVASSFAMVPSPRGNLIVATIRSIPLLPSNGPTSQTPPRLCLSPAFPPAPPSPPLERDGCTKSSTMRIG